MSGPSSSLASPLALLLVASALGCGLRSDPFAPTDTFSDDDDDDSGDDGDPSRLGTCGAPLALPFSPTTLRGELSGPSFIEGWCGADEGPEDVYLLVPDYDVDVILTLESAEFTPTLRVVEDNCAGTVNVTKICTRSFVDSPFHFLAQAGRTYSVIIDSPSDGEGEYEFSVDLGQPPLELCNVHPEVVQQLSGSAFIWSNEFSQGQGSVDSYCGGAGRENLFRVVGNYPGNAFVQVVPTGGLAPLISVRTECATLSELDCTSAGPGNAAELAFFIEGPGDYFLSVDQAEIGSGGYQLRVEFE